MITLPSSCGRPSFLLLTAFLATTGCVSGAKLRADAEVIRAELDQGRHAGGLRCAPRDLALAEANLEFAQTELTQGSSGRARAHLREADAATKRVTELSRDCAPKPKQEIVKIEEVDADGDGLVDAADQCPKEAGPVENTGCPVLDKDGDGLVDAQDKCPDEAGVTEEQGCPKQYKRVVVEKNRIQIKQQIKFRTGSAKIVGAESFAVLDEVAQALQDNPQLKKIRIEGHTDSMGQDASNLRLSQSRANAVLAELLKRSIQEERLEAVGFGETQPLASNSTATGRAENRRTEFNIVEQ